MGRNGHVDVRQLEDFRHRLQSIADSNDEFIESCAKELAARLLAKVIKRTPVGDYSGDSYTCEGGHVHKGHKVTGKVGGTLRRNWTIGEIKKIGGVFQIEVINPTEYASYVEYGHRTRNHKGWVKGHFMLTISEQEIERDSKAILERKLQNYLKNNLK